MKKAEMRAPTEIPAAMSSIQIGDMPSGSSSLAFSRKVRLAPTVRRPACVAAGRPRPRPAAALTRALKGRAAGRYCGPCEQGCITLSYFSSPWTTIAAAVSTGRCTVITDAVVSHVDTDPDTGLAQGVTYIDRLTRQSRQLRAKTVQLCASTLESTRILLNSGEGFCNSSGTLGRYLMDHLSAGMSGVLPVKEQHTWTRAPKRPTGMYIPRFLNLDQTNEAA